MAQADNEKIQKWVDEHDCDDYCKYCGCMCEGNGVIGSPNGPIFPPCADWDDEELIENLDTEAILADIAEEEEAEVNPAEAIRKQCEAIYAQTKKAVYVVNPCIKHLLEREGWKEGVEFVCYDFVEPENVIQWTPEPMEKMSLSFDVPEKKVYTGAVGNIPQPVNREQRRKAARAGRKKGGKRRHGK